MNGLVSFVVERQTILCAVISKIGVARGPEEAELVLRFAAADPPESHVHGFDVLGAGGVIDDSGDSGVAGLGRRLGLRPTNFDQ